MKTTVYCKFDFELTHCFPNVEDAGFNNVSYLQHLHRHKVFCTVEVPVYHNDRDIEFITLQHQLKDYVEMDKLGWSKSISMEQIAEKLSHKVIDLYGDNYKPVFIEVSEDNENGARLYN